jgi:hypothetical protein
MPDETAYGGVERRGGERVKVNFRARWQGAWATRAGEISSLSRGGCFIDTDDLVKTGEDVMIEMHLPVEGKITVWGQVVYQTADVGFAVRFFRFMQEEDRKRLEWLVRAEAARANRPGGDAQAEGAQTDAG